MKQIKLNSKLRSKTGRSNNKALRSEGLVPGVIYGEHGVTQLVLEVPALRKVLQATSGKAALIELSIEGEEESLYAITQEVQRDPCSDEYYHIDFKEIVRGKEMDADIPVHIVGTPRGVKDYGGVLEVGADTLRVRCRPRDLPENIEIDVTDLEIGSSIHLSAIEAPKGVNFLGDPETVIAACGASTAAKADDEEEAEAEAAAASESEAEGASEEKPEASANEEKAEA